MKRAVLVIDPDRLARRAIISALRYGGLDVETAAAPRAAIRRLRRRRFAGLVVDPDSETNPAQTIADLRAVTDAPIIVTSTRDDRAHAVELLDAGADDYLTRPFDPEELLARLRAVLRRLTSLEAEPPIVTDDFTMYVRDRRLVLADGTEPALSPTEWRLIEVLADHAGHLVTREEVLTAVWGSSAVDKTQYLRVHMAGIRHKIEPDPPRPRYFLTVPGLGLKFVPDPIVSQGVGM